MTKEQAQVVARRIKRLTRDAAYGSGGKLSVARCVQIAGCAGNFHVLYDLSSGWKYIYDNPDFGKGGLELDGWGGLKTKTSRAAR